MAGGNGNQGSSLGLKPRDERVEVHLFLDLSMRTVLHMCPNAMHASTTKCCRQLHHARCLAGFRVSLFSGVMNVGSKVCVCRIQKPNLVGGTLIPDDEFGPTIPIYPGARPPNMLFLHACCFRPCFVSCGLLWRTNWMWSCLTKSSSDGWK